MELRRTFLMTLAFVIAGTIILFVHGASSVIDTRTAGDAVYKKIEQLQRDYPELNQSYACQKLDDYVDAAKPKPGRPMLDLSFGWELERRVLNVRCKFQRFFENALDTLTDLEKELAQAKAELDKEKSR